MSNDRNNRNPISNARFSSEIMRPGRGCASKVLGLLRRFLSRHVYEQAQILLADVFLLKAAQGTGSAVERFGDVDLVGDERLDANVVDARQYWPLTKAVKNRASEITTEFGGNVVVPSAVRSGDKTSRCA